MTNEEFIDSNSITAGSSKDDNLINLDSSNPKLSASKRAKTERYGASTISAPAAEGEGYLTELFKSPLGMIRRMWTGFGNETAGSSALVQASVKRNNETDRSPAAAGEGAQVCNKSFRSAETMASSTARKIPAHLSVPKTTKQFKAEMSASSGRCSAVSRQCPPPPVRTIWPTSSFTLER